MAALARWWSARVLGLIASTFFAGAGASAVHTPAQQFGPFLAHSDPRGFGFSLAAQVESASIFAAATLLFSDHLGATVASGRVGWFVLDTAVTPYVAIGAGWLREGLEDGDQPPNYFTADGLAVLTEAGVTGLRNWRVGRLVACVQALQPLFSAPPDPNHAAPKTRMCILGGVRLLF